MKYFNFSSLIKKYETTFTVISTGKDDYILGELKPGKVTETIMTGAIIGISETKMYRSDGVLKAEDKQLFMVNPLSESLIDSTVIYKGNKYTIQNSIDNAEFTGIWSYTLKYISAFTGGGNTA